MYMQNPSMKLSQVLIECTLRETVCILSPILPQKIFNIKLFLNKYNLTLIFKPTVMALPPNEDNCFIRLLAYAFEFLPPPPPYFYEFLCNHSDVQDQDRNRLR